jgi:hypothetical protein
MQTISLDQLTRVTGGAGADAQQAPQDAGSQQPQGDGFLGGFDQILGGIEQFIGGLRALLAGFAQPQGQAQPQPQPDAQS